MTNKSIYSNKHRFLIQQLRKARLESNLTQKEVADTLGKTQSYISKIETGQLRVDVIQLEQFASLYKKNLKYFISKQ